MFDCVASRVFHGPGRPAGERGERGDPGGDHAREPPAARGGARPARRAGEPERELPAGRLGGDTDELVRARGPEQPAVGFAPEN